MRRNDDIPAATKAAIEAAVANLEQSSIQLTELDKNKTKKQKKTNKKKKERKQTKGVEIIRIKG